MMKNNLEDILLLILIGCPLLTSVNAINQVDHNGNNFISRYNNNNYNNNNVNNRRYQQQWDIRHNIPGEPEIDYPIYDAAPNTNFNCDNRHEGYYADTETRCQVFRVCANTDTKGDGFGFVCPNGTVFNQKKFVCDWYKNVDCNDSEKFYHMNKDLKKYIRNKDEMMKAIHDMISHPFKNHNQRNHQQFQQHQQTNQPLFTASRVKSSNFVKNSNQMVSNFNQKYPNFNKQNTLTQRNHFQKNQHAEMIKNFDQKTSISTTTTKLLPKTEIYLNYDKFSSSQKTLNNYFTQLQSSTPSLPQSHQSIVQHNNSNNINNDNNQPITYPSLDSNSENYEDEINQNQYVPFNQNRKVYISNLGELSTDYGSTFDPKTSIIINENSDELPSEQVRQYFLRQQQQQQQYEPNNVYTNFQESSGQNYINTKTDELTADQSINDAAVTYFPSRNQLTSSSSFLANNQNDFISPRTVYVQPKQQLNRIAKVTTANHYYQQSQNPSQYSNNIPVNLASNVNSVFQSRMDDGTQEFISTTQDQQPIFVGRRQNLAGFINSALDSEFRSGRQFEFQGSAFSKVDNPRQTLSTSYNIAQHSTSGNNKKNGNGRSYLPPQGFKIPNSPDISHYASGFKLNNRDSFSLTLSRNILDIPRLFTDDFKGNNNLQNNHQTTTRLAAVEKPLHKSNRNNNNNNNKSLPEKGHHNKNVTRKSMPEKAKHHEKSLSKTIPAITINNTTMKNSNKSKIITTTPSSITKSPQIIDTNIIDEIDVNKKSANLLLQGVHQALYENDTKSFITDNYLDVIPLITSSPSTTTTTSKATISITNSTTSKPPTTISVPNVTIAITKKRIKQLPISEIGFNITANQTSDKNIITFVAPTPIPVVEISHPPFTTKPLLHSTISNRFGTKLQQQQQQQNRNYNWKSAPSRSSTKSVSPQPTRSNFRQVTNRRNSSRLSASTTTTTIPSSVSSTRSPHRSRGNNNLSRVHFEIGEHYRTPTTTTTSVTTTAVKTTTPDPYSSSTTFGTTPKSRRRPTTNSNRQNQLSKVSHTLRTTTQNPSNNLGNNHDHLADLTPLANSYGYHRNNYNRIRNETQKTGYFRSKGQKKINKNFDNLNNIDNTDIERIPVQNASSLFSILSSSPLISSSSPFDNTASTISTSTSTSVSVSYRSEGSQSSNVKHLSRQSSKKIISNQIDSHSQPPPNTSRKPIIDRDQNAKDSVTEDSKRPSSAYVELPGTKVIIAKSQEHGHFAISNDPKLANNNQGAGYRKPFVALDQYVSNSYAKTAGQNKQATQLKNPIAAAAISGQLDSSFFLPFPTISPPRPPQTQSYRPQIQSQQPIITSHANIKSNNNNNNIRQYPTYQTQLYQPPITHQQRPPAQQYLSQIIPQQNQLLSATTETPYYSIQPSATATYYQKKTLADNSLNAYSLLSNGNGNGNSIQYAQKRLDVVEDPVKEKSLYSGVSSYDVSLGSVGRLPTDIVGIKKK